MSFSSLNLDDRLLSGLIAAGYETATPIQIAAIPALLAGKDVMAGAQTGTGKTAGRCTAQADVRYSSVASWPEKASFSFQSCNFNSRLID